MSMKETFMRAPWPMKVLFYIAIALIYILVFSTIVMVIWNAILPNISNLQPITFLQAIGLLILSKILFGSMNFSPKKKLRSQRKNWGEKWRSMSADEKTEMKERWKNHCAKRKNEER